MNKIKFTLVACARDESLNINEWLDYNFSIGIDRVYLYCNDDDPYHLYKTASPYMSRSNERLIFKFCTAPGAQKFMYKDFILNHMGEEEWVMFIDVDEFITLKSYNSLHDFVDNFKDADVIQLSWYNFGSNGHLYDSPRLKIPEYTKRNRYPDPGGKVIVKQSSIDRNWTVEGLGTYFHGFEI